MSTYLKIRWERTEDNSHHEEVWERENDGILFMIFQTITSLIHTIRRLRDEQGY